MSSSGINAINSGPLIIRSYLGSSSNNTYALGDNDIPISSNRVLITSTNGLVVLSDNIYVSSITVSSINGGGGGGNDVFWSSTLNNGGIVNTNTGSVYINTSLQCSTITDVSTINGLPYPPQNDVFWSSTLNNGNIVNTNTGNVNISTALNVVGNILSNNSYTLYNVAGAYGTLSITQSTSAGFGYINCDNLTFRTSNGGTPTSVNVDGSIYATGSAISRVATATIVADPTSSGWINYLGKYCFVNGDSLSILTLPTAGDVPPDGTIIVIRNIGASGNITVNNVVGGASIILSGRTTSFIYTTTVTSGWYTL
jgi:hypothetical protein